MKQSKLLTILVLLAMVLVALPAPMAAQEASTPEHPRAPHPSRSEIDAAPPPQLEWGGTWQYGLDTTFAFTRFDGEYYPGDGLVYFMGGRLAAGAPDTDGSVWSFDPGTSLYADTGTDIPSPISNYKMNLLQDGSGNWGFYTFCGRPADGGITGVVQVYYPDTNTAAQLPPADDYPGTGNCTSGLNVVYDNKAYIAGGFDPAQPGEPYNWDETWIFDPTAPSGSMWTQIPSATLNIARAYIMGAVVDDMIYAIGGNWYDPTSGLCGQLLCNETMVEVLDPNAATPVWDDAAVADLPEECSASRAYGFDSGVPYTDPDGTPFGGKIVSGCGWWADENEHVYVYDAAFDFWDVFPYLQTDRRDHAGAFVPPPAGGLMDYGVPGMWVWGGRKDTDTTVLTSAEYYDVVSGTQECSVLLVDDDWDFDPTVGENDGGRPYYTSTLEFLGQPYSLWDTVSMGTPSSGDMDAYDVVVWFTGYDWQTPISPTEEVELMTYLDNGGNLFVSNQEQEYAFPGSTIMSDYFWVDTIVEDVTLTGTVGSPSDPLFSALGPYDMGRPDLWYTYWPTATYQGPYDDEAYVKAGGFEPMLYTDNSNPNSTRFEGAGFKAIYLAYPFEWITDLDDRAELLDTALTWFCETGQAEFDLVPPGQIGNGAPGEVVSYTLTIINNLGTDQTFDITYDSIWAMNGPATVGPVPNGGSEDFEVGVAIPAGLACYESDIGTVTAVVPGTPLSDTSVIETTALPDGTGNLHGYVYDANTGAGIEDAYVYVEMTEDDTAETWTDADGYYSIADLSICTYDGQYEAVGYFGQTGIPLTISDGMTITQDITLTAAGPELSDDAVSVSVPATSTDTFNLGVTNNGTGDLHFHVSEVPNDSGYPVPGPLTVPSMPAGIDAEVYADLADAPGGNGSFIVYLAEQADLSAAFRIQDRSARGHYVLNILRSLADRTQAGLRADLDRAGVEYTSHYIVNALVVKGDASLAENLIARPEVAYVGPNAEIPAPAPIESSAGVDAVDATSWGIERTHAISVWQEFDAYGAGIIVANIDTGVDYDHPALVNQYRGNEGGGTYDHNYNWWDPYGYDPDYPVDWNNHGSHTIGTMAGSDSPTEPLSATEIIGMAPQATWFTCQGFDKNVGSGTNEALLSCAAFTLAPWDLSGDPDTADPDMRADIVNNSWGGGQAQWWYNQAIYAWRAAGIMPVFSAGNDGPNCDTMGDPGDMDMVMAVGATTETDAIAGFSSRGPAAISGLLKPNVSAPGVSIWSSIRDGNYGFLQGTSMAAPHVSGQAALIWSAVPELRGDVQLTYWIIEQNSRPITTTEGCGGDGPTDVPNNTFGWGIIDAHEAVSKALNSNWDIPWLDVDPVSGVLSPTESADIVLTFDTTGLAMSPPCYTGTLKVEFNDPYVTEQFVPVELCVVEAVEDQYFIYLPVVLKDH